MNLLNYKARHFNWDVREKIAFVTLNRPEKKNPLTFESYAELRDTFRGLQEEKQIKAVVIKGAGGNFCSGGDVHEIIGPLVAMSKNDLLGFTQMTGDLILAIREAPQIVISAIDGVCAGAGAAIAMASDLRVGTDKSRTAFLFVRVGLAGCDMGACSLLPRIIGQGRATELLLSGRSISGDEAFLIGFFNRIVSSEMLDQEAQDWAIEIATGPTFAHAMTKRMLNQEWNVGIREAIKMEAEAQAVCMETKDFKRAYQAFVKKEKPVFEGD